MIEQCRRILGMLALAVEAADDCFANHRLFRGIAGLYHPFRQSRQFVSRQASFGVQLVSKTDHAQLFLRIEPLDFLDDFARGHVESVSQTKVTINLTLVCVSWPFDSAADTAAATITL